MIIHFDDDGPQAPDWVPLDADSLALFHAERRLDVLADVAAAFASVTPRQRERMLAKVNAFLDEREALEISDLAKLMSPTRRPLQ
jgi:hypothetical protein